MDIQTELVEGNPLEIEGRKLIPIVHKTSGIWRGATVGQGYSGNGGGFVHLRPTGIIERTGEDDRLIPIVDQTAKALWGLLAAAIAVPLLLIAAVRLSNRR